MLTVSALVLSACGSAGAHGSAGEASSVGPGSTFAASWVATPSKIQAVRLVLKTHGTRARGSIEIVSTYSGAFDSRVIQFKGAVSKHGLTLHLSDSLGVTHLDLRHEKLHLLPIGDSLTQTLVPGSKRAFAKQARRVRQHGRYLSFVTAVDETNDWAKSVSSQTARLSAFGPEVIGVDASVLEQDAQQSASNLTWVQDNVGGSFSTFICIGYTGAAQALAQARSAYKEFQSDAVKGNVDSTQLSRSVDTMESAFSEVQTDEARWSFSSDKVSIDLVSDAELNAENTQNGWLGYVSEYSNEASTYMARTSEQSVAAENLVLGGNTYGC